MKRAAYFLLALALAASLCPSAAAWSGRDERAVAEALQTLGLFRGSGADFELDRQPTRAEEVVLLLRLLGVRDEALGPYAARCPFDDVPGWARGHVAYAAEQGLAGGVGGGKFGTDVPATAQMFAAFVLRAMGYVDDTRGGTDFAYANAEDFAARAGELGIVCELYSVEDEKNTHSWYTAGLFLESREENKGLDKFFSWIEERQRFGGNGT